VAHQVVRFIVCDDFAIFETDRFSMRQSLNRTVVRLRGDNTQNE